MQALRRHKLEIDNQGWRALVPVIVDRNEKQIGAACNDQHKVENKPACTPVPGHGKSFYFWIAWIFQQLGSPEQMGVFHLLQPWYASSRAGIKFALEND
jgi:hypothetical protein